MSSPPAKPVAGFFWLFILLALTMQGDRLKIPLAIPFT